MANKKSILVFSSITAIVFIVLILFIKSPSEDIQTDDKKVIDINLLSGDWVRTDADYLMKIIRVNKDGMLEAQYFNPKPINIESAIWEQNNSNLNIIITLRDVYYPGSKYTLSYLPDRDILAGEYFQAVQSLTFYVEFIRNK